MKAKYAPLIALICGLFLAALCLFLPIIRTVSTDIIGGGGWPIYWLFLTRMGGGTVFCGLLFGIAMAVTALPAVIFRKAFDKACNLVCSGIAMGLSAFGGLGLTCFFYCYALGAFNETSNHPIGYPISLFLGALSLIFFIALSFLYFLVRIEKRSFLGFFYDVACSILYLPGFFMFTSFVASLFQG